MSSVACLASAMSKMRSESERRRINSIPAMTYHSVGSEDAALMRMNAVPRSVAEELARL